MITFKKETNSSGLTTGSYAPVPAPKYRFNPQLEPIAEFYRRAIESYINKYIELGSTGDLILYKSQINTLGNLEIVNGTLDLSFTPINSLGNLKIVAGDLVLYCVNELYSLGNVERVGGNLILTDSYNITSLDNINEIGGDLTVYGNPFGAFNSHWISDHPASGKNMWIPSTLKSFGKLKSVGGNLNIDYSPIAHSMTEEEIRSKLQINGNVNIRRYDTCKTHSV
jgi:hypothetical protein